MNEKPTVTAEELWKKHSFENYNFVKIMDKDGFDEATASLQSEVERLRGELKDSEGFADVIQNVMTPDLCPIDTKELGQNAYFIYRMYWAIDAKNRELTAEVEKLKQRVESAYKAGWESAYHKGQRQHESFEEWKASRGKGSGDQPNAG